MSTTTVAQRDSWLSGLVSALATFALVVLLAAAVALAVVPKALDGAALTVLTGSMVPTYDPGDVVVVRGVDDATAEVQVGDVVTFQPVSDDPTLITHRVVGKLFTADGTMFVTRGDANSADDAPLLPAQIKAVAVYHVPWVGHVSLALGQQRGLIVVGVAVALLVYGAVMVLRPERRRSDGTPQAPAPGAGALPQQAPPAAAPAALPAEAGR
ncbi:signal peptidase I [Cellulomonas xiejunii]|uniref:Signal peptidase I n=1 Tax=Cellulomonas xiejunii TaxID=2968083 RepID=A0ABY5KLR4_9CELL|nr:signal peptidase I [Cellulomonas xiejunii]MCC2312655.1 signal peptidase I [Cellulomonas xiejunii]MCC2320475.1 signal peptidase I [Cellulomonas xiejunii]UUI70770.1 signal peptidase I [Cellulomonas xiejunii]